MPPVPDLFMPFNVVGLVGMFYAFVMGATLNILSKKVTTKMEDKCNGRPERNDPGTSAQRAGIRYRGQSRLSENRRENPNCHLSTGQTKEDRTTKTLPSGATCKSGSAATLPEAHVPGRSAHNGTGEAQRDTRATTTQTHTNGHQARVPATACVKASRALPGRRKCQRDQGLNGTD